VRDQRVVGAAQNQRIDPVFLQGGQRGFHHSARLLRATAIALHQGYKGGTSVTDNIQMRGRPPQRLLIGSAPHRSLGPDHPDPPAGGRPDGRTGSGLDHPQHRYGRSLPDLIQGHGRGGIACDDQGPEGELLQKPDDLQRKAEHLLPRSRTVGTPTRISKIDDAFRGELAHHFLYHRQSANTGIQYADRRLVTSIHSSFSPPFLRVASTNRNQMVSLRYLMCVPRAVTGWFTPSFSRRAW